MKSKERERGKREWYSVREHVKNKERRKRAREVTYFASKEKEYEL